MLLFYAYYICKQIRISRVFFFGFKKWIAFLYYRLDTVKQPHDNLKYLTCHEYLAMKVDFGDTEREEHQGCLSVAGTEIEPVDPF